MFSTYIYTQSSEFVVVAVGGGGSSKSGVPNGIFMTTVSEHDLTKSSARFGHTSEQFLDMGSELPFAVALSTTTNPICAVTIGPSVHLYIFNEDVTVGLEKLTEFTADFCESSNPCINFCRFSGSNIITAGADNIIRVWSIDEESDRCVLKMMAELEKIPKDINDVHTCIRSDQQLDIVSASDDGKLRLWHVDVASSSSTKLIPFKTLEVPDDGNRDRRAGKAIFKAARWGRVQDQAAPRPADQLLFGVQSRMNRGSSYLIVWRIGHQNQDNTVLSRIRLFPGTDDKVRSMALTCSPWSSHITAAFGSAGGLVSAVHVEEATGKACVVGQDVRHATIVSDVAAASLANGEGLLVTTSMDKGLVFHAVEGLIAKTRGERRKRCLVNLILLVVFLLLSSACLWYYDVINEEKVMGWKQSVEEMIVTGSGSGNGGIITTMHATEKSDELSSSLVEEAESIGAGGADSIETAVLGKEGETIVADGNEDVETGKKELDEEQDEQDGEQEAKEGGEEGEGGEEITQEMEVEIATTGDVETAEEPLLVSEKLVPEDSWSQEHSEDLIAEEQPMVPAEDTETVMNTENIQALPPAHITGGMEAPAGEKDMGGWTRGIYTAEQRERLGVDEDGKNVDGESMQ